MSTLMLLRALCIHASVYFQAYIPVIEEKFWVLIVANFQRQCFETYCPYNNAQDVDRIAGVVIANFKRAHHGAYHSHPFSAHNMQIKPVQIVTDDSNE